MIVSVNISPFAFHLGIGIVIWLDNSVNMQTGVEVTLLGWMAYSLFIALGLWYNNHVRST